MNLSLSLSLLGESRALEEVGFFDISNNCASTSNPWLGSWSNFPFFRSGSIAVASIEMGLFVLKVRLSAWAGRQTE